MAERAPDDLAFMQWLVDQGYLNVRPIGGGRWAGTYQYLFTHAIVCGAIGDQFSFSGRWCYRTRGAAELALAAWDGTGEPEGWHRAPFSGRRRTAEGEEILPW